MMKLKLSHDGHCKRNGIYYACMNLATFSRFAKWYQGLFRNEEPAPQPPFSHVSQVGDPMLRMKAELVDIDEIRTAKIQKSIYSMKKVLRHYDAVGLAAPQIGLPLRIIMVEFSTKMMELYPPEIRASRDMTVCPLTIFVNPVVKIQNPLKVIFPEGCESIKGFSALVSRHYEIQVSGYNEDGVPHEMQFKGWPARIVQHEMDHLEGTLLTDVMDPKSFQFDYWYTVNVTGGRYRHPFN